MENRISTVVKGTVGNITGAVSVIFLRNEWMSFVSKVVCLKYTNQMIEYLATADLCTIISINFSIISMV